MLVVGKAQILHTIVTTKTVLNIWFFIKDINNFRTFKKGKIMEEYEKGYKYHDKIIRHAKVVVSKGKSK